MVAVVTGFAVIHDGVTTNVQHTKIITGIVVDLVAVVAGFAVVHDAVATNI